MWVLIEPLLIKYGIPFAISLLEKTGAINELESLAIKGFIGAKNLNIYQEYPNPPPIQTNNNLKEDN